MNVRFTNADHHTLYWDGLLWQSKDFPDLATSLNQLALPEGGRHSSILNRAQSLLSYTPFHTATYEILDHTGWPLEHLGEDVSNTTDRLAGQPNPAQDTAHDRTAETGPQSSALHAAEAHLRGGLCSDDQDDEDEDDWDAPEREWADLVSWCRERNLISNDPGPERTGGREHDVRFSESDGRWWKYTKPNLAGYTVGWSNDGNPFLRNALASEYLSRLRRRNQVV